VDKVGAEQVELLKAYAPLLRYHEDERFRATAIESLVEAAPPGAALRGAVTELKNAEGETIASTAPAPGGERLSVSLLCGAGREYGGTGIKAHRRDFLSGRLPEAFAFTGPPIAYGRVSRLPDGEAWLQYWLFSYENPHHLVGDHQGDWELIQLKVDPGKTPAEGGLLAATCFQHGSPDGREREELEALLDPDGRLPVVVARGSHASYFDLEYVHFGDELQVDAPAEPCRVVELDEKAPWMSWPGYWGRTKVMDHPRSPRGPMICRPEWEEPQAQHEAGVYARGLRRKERIPAVMVSTSVAPATGRLGLIVQADPDQPDEDLRAAAEGVELGDVEIEALQDGPLPRSGKRQFLLDGVPRTGDNPFDVARALEAASGGEWEVEPDLDSTIFRPSPNGYRICDLLGQPTSDPRWAVEQIGCFEAWKESRGAGVLVGHPDTGYCDHPQLSGAIGPGGYDVLDDDPDPHDVLTGIPPAQFPGHGTGTASVIASRDEGIDLAGSAPEALVLPFRVSRSVVLLRGGRLLKGIQRARDAECKVISISLGGLFLGSGLRNQLDAAVAEGRIVIAAAGQPLRFVVEPASYASTIGVAGTTIDRVPWEWTACGESVDVCAPAAHVPRAAAKSGKVERGDGTSFSTALTAGVAALWCAAKAADLAREDPAAIAPKFRSLLKMSAAAKAPAGWDSRSYGAGIVDAAGLLALDLADARPEAPPEEVSRGKRIIKWFARLVEEPVEDVADWIDKTFDGRPEEAAERVGTELASLSSEDESVRRALKQVTAEGQAGLPAPLQAQASVSLQDAAGAQAA
jgi:subtilisin family serine protease